MIFGFIVKPETLVFGGMVLFVLMGLQVLQGMRKIKFKGPLHLKVHKRGAWVLLAFAAFHGLLGLAYGLELSIG
ncbi:MAG: hypothetical protein U1E26_11240 [Coriobacteriia bacterium]|nr:hypothetical protein [Coriobacteriia bacterium]